ARVYALAVAELSECVASEAPLALLVDDLHWMDRHSRQLLAAVVQRMAAHPVLVVTTSRRADTAAAREDTEFLSLRAIEPQHVALVLTGLGTLPDTGWANDLAKAVHRFASGSPLLTIEALRLASSRQLLTLRDGHWSSGDPVKLFELLAEGGALRQRIADLDAEKRALVILMAAA